MAAYARPHVHQDETLREVQRFVDREFERRPLRDVLDAGCGFTLPLDFPRNVRLVGLDASAEALAKNENIDVAIVGDIEIYPLEKEQYDAIICWTVLEHLATPRAALENMAHALRPGGLIIIGVPNIWSLKGLLTKLTPYRFHVWVYRRLFGWENAGQPGVGPYPTHMHRDIAPGRLAQLARAAGLERVYASTHEVDPGLPRPLAVLWSVATTVGRVASLGRWKPALSDHVAVFRKIDASKASSTP